MYALKKRGLIQDIAMEALLAPELAQPIINVAFKESLDELIDKHRAERG